MEPLICSAIGFLECEQRRQEILAVFKPNRPLVSVERAQQDLCGWNCAGSKKNSFRTPAQWLVARAVVTGNFDFIFVFAHVGDNDAGLIGKIWMFLKLDQSIGRTVNVAVGATIHAEAAIDATIMVIGTRAADRQTRLAEMDANRFQLALI